MKTLIIVRHAKSSWDDPLLRDKDRPLNDRGKIDAPRMGKRLKEKEFPVQLMVTSPAKRARSTCKRIAKVLSYPKESIQTEPALYHASEDQWMKIIRDLPQGCDTVMMFGHNPGLTDIVNLLMNESILNVPTCGVVAGHFDVENWEQITWGSGKMFLYDYPKSRED